MVESNLKQLIIEAILRAEDEQGYIGGGMSITELAADSNTSVELVGEVVQELLELGVARQNPWHDEDHFVLDDVEGKRWRRRLGM